MPEDLHRPKLLVIDDEIGPRESLRFLLNNEFDVTCAESVDSGVECLRAESPDAVIMDIKMPGKTGIEGLREIREIDTDVSVVMLTGFGSLETAQEAIRHGATDYVKKPFDSKEMTDTIRLYAERTRVARARSHASAELEALNRRMQTELEEKERLALLGQASSEFVHDLRSPLTVIYGYVQILAEELQQTGNDADGQASESLEYLQQIEKSVQRCQEMSDLWRDLGSNDPSRRKPTRVAEIMKDVVESSTPLAAEVSARVELCPGPDDLMINADSLQLFRAVQNIVSNAIQALPRSDGVVSVAWTDCGNAVEILVRDNGCGIEPDKLDTVFNA